MSVLGLQNKGLVGGWGRIVFAVLAAIGLIGLALVLSGCMFKSEHRGFVEGTRAYFDVVAPVYSSAIRADAGLAEQSKKNRLGVQEDFATALGLAEERVK